jgi:PIN domain nuclease of toxin-antitoxin system
MSALVTDTHAVIWYLPNQKALSETARDAFELASRNGFPVYLPTISLVEICYLVEKVRLPVVALERVNEALNLANAALVAVPLSLDIARVLSQVPRDKVPDMPDRIIAATALHLNLPLITRDRKIQASNIESIW